MVVKMNTYRGNRPVIVIPRITTEAPVLVCSNNRTRRGTIITPLPLRNIMIASMCVFKRDRMVIISVLMGRERGERKNTDTSIILGV